MSDWRAVAHRMAPKIAEATPEESLRHLEGQCRRAWNTFLRMSTKRYDLAQNGENTDELTGVLMERDQELARMEANIARVSARVEAGT